MAAAKKTANKKATKKAAAKRAPAKQAAAKKATAKKAPAKKSSKKTSAKKTTKKTTGAASVGNVIVTSKVKEAVKAGDVRMAGDFPEALNAEVQATIDKAIARAKGNNRGTVRPSDL